LANAIYHASLKSVRGRGGNQPNLVTFGAASDGAAATIAGLIEDACDAKLVALSTRLAYDAAGVVPAGSRYSVSVLARADDESIGRFRLRNMKSDTTDGDIAALFKGEAAPLVGTKTFLALSAPPYLPGSGEDITSASVSITLKP